MDARKEEQSKTASSDNDKLEEARDREAKISKDNEKKMIIKQKGNYLLKYYLTLKT